MITVLQKGSKQGPDKKEMYSERFGRVLHMELPSLLTKSGLLTFQAQ